MDPREQRLREIDETLEELADDRTYRPSRMPPPPLDTRDLGAVDDALARLGDGVGVPSAPAAAAALALPSPGLDGSSPAGATRNGMDVPGAAAASPPPGETAPGAGADGSAGSLDKRSLVALFGEDPDDPDAGSVVSLLPVDPGSAAPGSDGPRSSSPPLGGISSRPPSGPPSATFRRPREDAPAAPTPLPRPPWDPPTDQPTAAGEPDASDAAGGLPDAASLWPPARSSSVPSPEAFGGPSGRTPPPPRRSTPPPPPVPATPPQPAGARSLPPPVPVESPTSPPPGPAEGGFGDMRPTPLRPVPVDPAVAARVSPGAVSYPGPGAAPPAAPDPASGDSGDDVDELSMELDDLLIIDEASAAEPLPGPTPPGPPRASPGAGDPTEYEDALDDLLHVTTDDDVVAHPPANVEPHAARFASWPDVAAPGPAAPPTEGEDQVLSEDSVARSVSFAPDDTAAGVDAPDIPPMPPAVDVDALDVSVDDEDGGPGEDDRKGFFRRIFGKK